MSTKKHGTAEVCFAFFSCTSFACTLHALIVYAIYIYCEILHDVNDVWQTEKSGFCVNCTHTPRFVVKNEKIYNIEFKTYTSMCVYVR